MNKLFLLITGFCLLCTGCGNSSNSGGFEGKWNSDPVRLERGTTVENYRFYLDAGEKHLDLVYHTAADPSDERTVRQMLSMSLDEEHGVLILAGSNPELIRGPQFVGEYEPDVLYCDIDTIEEDKLFCRWGSDGHDSAPLVTLKKNVY